MKKTLSPFFKWFILSGIILLVSGLFWVIWTKTNSVHKLFQNNEDYRFSESWDEKNYSELYQFSISTLQDKPLNRQALTYLGLSSFYLALRQPDREDQLFYINESIYAFRKLLYMATDEEKTIIYYYLGKCYVLKGPYYSDLAVMYLERTLEDGFNQNDTYEFLGEAYYNLDEYQKSLFYLDLSFQQNPSAQTALIIGEVQEADGNLNQAIIWYNKALELIKDQTFLKEGLFKLAKLYYDNNDLEKSEETLNKYIEIEKNDPDAYFLLGEIYFYKEDISTARKFWFMTTRLDPDYKPALYRLYD